MFTNTINPILLDLGYFQIRYYGLLFLLSVIIGYFLFIYLAKERRLRIKRKEVDDFFIYALLGGLIFARLFYIFENFDFYMRNPIEMIAFWHGGLSFFGSLIGAVLATYIFCRIYKKEFYQIADIAVIPLALGLAFGRIANFTNSELYGKITNLPWCVNFKNVDGCRHPSQIYESIKNFVIFFTLFSLRNKEFKRGALFWMFVTMYSFLRFFMEFFREPQLLIYGLTLYQIYAVVGFCIGAYFLFKK